MTRITNTILFPSIPNPQYKQYSNGRLTLIIPSHPSRCVSRKYNQNSLLIYTGNDLMTGMDKLYTKDLQVVTE